MSDNLTTGTSLSSVASGTAVATKDLSAHGGTGHAQKFWLLSGTYTCTGSDVAISVSTSVVKSAVGLTIPSNTTHMLITTDSNGGDVRFREDGTDPTAAQGVLVEAGSMLELPVPATAANLRFILANTSSSGAGPGV